MSKIPVLIYHDIYSENEPAEIEPKGKFIYTLSLKEFQLQMSFLADNSYKTISLKDYIDSVRNKIELPNNALIITFDDGHITNYKNAFPALKEYGFVATFFITVKNIGCHDGLTLEQLKEMETQGMSIQSHTMTHPFLSDISRQDILWELSESKKALENKLGKTVSYLALPGGRYSLLVKEIARQVGYEAVCTSIIGYNSLDSDLFSIKRWAILRGAKISDFASILQKSYHYLAYNKGRYILLTGLKKILGNKAYDSIRDKVI